MVRQSSSKSLRKCKLSDLNNTINMYYFVSKRRQNETNEKNQLSFYSPDDGVDFILSHNEFVAFFRPAQSLPTLLSAMSQFLLLGSIAIGEISLTGQIFIAGIRDSNVVPKAGSPRLVAKDCLVWFSQLHPLLQIDRENKAGHRGICYPTDSSIPGNRSKSSHPVPELSLIQCQSELMVIASLVEGL